MNLASQFESCMSVCSRSSSAWRFLEHILHKVGSNVFKMCRGLNNRSTANLLTNQPVKECWKSVKISRSYRREFGGLLFWTTV